MRRDDACWGPHVVTGTYFTSTQRSLLDLPLQVGQGRLSPCPERWQLHPESQLAPSCLQVAGTSLCQGRSMLRGALSLGGFRDLDQKSQTDFPIAMATSVHPPKPKSTQNSLGSESFKRDLAFPE